MKYYSIQHIEAWEKAKEKGYLEGDKEFVYEDFKEPYLWMIEQIKHRLSNYKGEYPIWLWLNRPDLRRTAHLPKGEKGILLEINLDENNVLVSDFDAWHFVLNEWIFTAYEDEEIDMKESWERIFDLELLKSLEDWGEDLILQGVTGRVSLKDIKPIKEFVAR